jgi:osmotically-inducible protein OsmY
MKTARSLLIASFVLAIPSCNNSLFVLRASAATLSTQAPDNSAQNQNQGATADSQGNAKADRMTLAQVRRAVIADKALSTYAHNIKILVVNGTVTLKGPVNSDDERQKVFADVANVVSADKIANQLTLKP